MCWPDTLSVHLPFSSGRSREIFRADEKRRRKMVILGNSGLVYPRDRWWRMNYSLNYLMGNLIWSDPPPLNRSRTLKILSRASQRSPSPPPMMWWVLMPGLASLFQEFDSTYGPAWHCIVGTSFGSYVTHSLGGFLYFSVDKVHILLFRTAVEPLEKWLGAPIWILWLPNFSGGFCFPWIFLGLKKYLRMRCRGRGATPSNFL